MFSPQLQVFSFFNLVVEDRAEIWDWKFPLMTQRKALKKLKLVRLMKSQERGEVSQVSKCLVCWHSRQSTLEIREKARLASVKAQLTAHDQSKESKARAKMRRQDRMGSFREKTNKSRESLWICETVTYLAIWRFANVSVRSLAPSTYWDESSRLENPVVRGISQAEC